MKPLYVKKNGVVYKISGNGMPALYPAENVEYDNTVTSELQATDVQSAIDELSTREAGVQSDWNENDSAELDYIKNKPQNLVRDASYVHTDNNYDATAKGKVDALGTASTKDAGVANGVAELDAAGKVPSSQLPSFVDDVIEVADYDHLPITGESGKIYVTIDTNKTYRWTGSGYVEISESLALGETSSTAYRGDRGKTAYDHATETKLSTATASGLYKVAATAQGHIASLTPVQKSDITALGIPAQDTIIKNTAYGTCDTAGDVKDKVATLVNATNWSLEVGTIVGVRFTYTNTCSLSGISLNVNNTGAKNIRYSDGILTSGTDPKCPTAFGEAGQTIYYMYDGTYWVWVSHSKDNDTTYAFEGNTFRSEDGSNYYHGDGTNGNANNMTTNGHYYYKSNGPSTAIGAYGNDGAMFVQAYDSDNVAQIAQNYENGNLFVRGKANGSWTDWKKPIANITGNNAVLTTDKTPFLTRQTLNPTGFSGYVREKLVGASYAWNQLVQNGNFANTSGWSTYQATISVSNNVCTMVRAVASGSNSMYRVVTKQPNHKYLWSLKVKNNVGSNSIMVQWFKSGTSGTTMSLLANTAVSNNYTTYSGIIATDSADADGALIIFLTTATVNNSIDIKDIQLVDLTLAFGSTIADYLYGLSNNGGITKLRDMGCPIDKYTPYGNGLYSVKTSGKKIVGKNLFDDSTDTMMNTPVGYWAQNDNTVVSFLNTLGVGTYAISFKMKINTVRAELGHTYGIIVRGSNMSDVTMRQNVANPSAGQILSFSGILTITANNKGSINYAWMYTGRDNGATTDLCTFYEFQIEEGSSATTYAPYAPVTYPLGNDELRGKFDLVNGEIVASGDVKESNGGITRKFKYVEFDGSQDENWSLQTNATSGNTRFYCPFTTNAPNESSTAHISNQLLIASGNNASQCYSVDGVFAMYNNKTIYISGSFASDVATLKTKLASNPLKVVYTLATPATEQSTPFADPMSMVGATTEEYIDTRDVPCPVGAERQYMGQSEDIIEIPSSPQSDGKRVLISEVSGGKEQVYWDIPKLYYKEYTVQGDGTKTYGNLLAELKPYYLTLSEDEKTYSKVMMRATSSGNECLTFVGNYWYSRMGVNASGLWLDQIDFQYNRYFKQMSGGSITEETNTNAAYNVIALRVLTYTRAES